MIYYKVRRKSDGAYYPFYRRTKQKQDEFYRQFSSAVRLYNSAGWSGDVDAVLARYRNKKNGGWFEHYYKTEEEYKNYWLSVPTYADLELVKFGPTGEIIVWSGDRCTMTIKEANTFEPGGIAPLTAKQKQAGIRDEIGPILDKIEEAEAKLSNGKEYNVVELLAEIDLKRSKLSSALEELQQQSDKLREVVYSIYLR